MKIFSPRAIHYQPADPDITFVFSYLKRKGNTRSELNNFINSFSKEKPDILFFYKDEELTPTMLKRLKSISPATKFVMTYWDQRGCIPPVIMERRGLLDALLINNEDPAQFAMYKTFGIPKVFTFHHGFPINEFRDLGIKPTYNIFFGGNNFNHGKFPLSKFRYDFITRVYKLFGKMVVYGSGWPFPTKKSVPRNVYAQVLQTAHINLGMNHYSILRYYDRRLFECMASGRVHITKYVPGMEKHFENYKHLIWFNSMKEGLNAIQSMIKYPQKREMIAAAGKKLMCEQHSFDVRAVQFRNILMSL